MQPKHNYRKRIVHEIHRLKHRKKYIYQTIYHPKKRYYPEDQPWLDSLAKEYEQIEEQVKLLEHILNGNFQNY